MFSFWSARNSDEDFPRWGLAFAWALLADYTLILIFGSLSVSVVGGLLLAAAMLLGGSRRAVGQGRFGLLIFLFILATLQTALDPISGWDARSIWFFHAKMIFHSGGLVESAGWANPAWAWAHAVYPKLGPVLAAQVAWAAGFWNEYLPKLGPALLLLPALCWLVGETRARTLSSWLLLLWLLAQTHPLNRDGYMDGWVALYLALAVVFLGRWLAHHLGESAAGLRTDGAVGIACLGLAAGIKSEFSVFLPAVLFAGAAYSAWRYVRARVRFDRRTLLVGATALGAALIPFGLWSLRQKQWGLQGWLKLDGAALQRLVERLGDGKTFALVFRSLWLNSEVVATILIAALCLAIGRARRIPAGIAIFAFGTALLYLSGISLIYLLSPFDVQWQLNTSANRTLLTFLCAGYAGIYLLLSRYERPKG